MVLWWWWWDVDGMMRGGAIGRGCGCFEGEKGNAGVEGLGRWEGKGRWVVDLSKLVFLATAFETNRKVDLR